jgi:hypothetical protein
VRLLLAHVDFLVCHFAISESVNEAIHALQATPLCFTVNLHVLDLLFEIAIDFHLRVIAASISFASIFDNDCTLTRVGIHQSLILIALRFFRLVGPLLPLALLDFVIVVFGCHLASMLCSKVFVKHSVCETTTPTSWARLCPFGSMHMATAKCDGQTCDVTEHTLTSSLPDDDSIVLLGAPLLRNGSKCIALQILDLQQSFLLAPASPE